jgi:hypothetical protein
MVPVIVADDWAGISGPLPVIGARHTDADDFNFPWPHYHVDVRFLTAREYRRAGGGSYKGWSAEMVVAGLPISNSNRWTGEGSGIPVGRPPLARRRCSRVQPPYAAGDQSTIKRFREKRGEPDAIILKDGRQLCPHRRVDLSTISADADGLTTCPLHGLRVRCKA